ISTQAPIQHLRRLRRRSPGSATELRGPDSSAGFESKREAFRELCLPDRALRAFDVVAHSPELKCLPLDVPDAVARGRAAVPWLADAAWVHQSRTFQTEGVHPVLVSDLTVSEPKYPRYMRMPVKANSAVEQLEVGVRDGGVE